MTVHSDSSDVMLRTMNDGMRGKQAPDMGPPALTEVACRLMFELSRVGNGLGMRKYIIRACYALFYAQRVVIGSCGVGLDRRKPPLYRRGITCPQPRPPVDIR
jgi:hypothetical protein